MLFWLLKDAQLACKRCPLRPLLTPFWSPIKHFLKSSFITRWFTDDCKLTFYTYFSPILGTLYLKSCNIFSTLSNDIKKRSKRAKQTLFRPSFIPLFTFKIWGISHFTEGVSKYKYHFDNLTVWNNLIKNDHFYTRFWVKKWSFLCL